MKRIIFVIALFISVFGFAQNRTIILPQATTTYDGSTFIDMTMSVGTDYVSTGQTYWILFDCKKDFPQMQDVYVALDSITGNPDITVTMYGRKFTGDTWTQVGTPVQWCATTGDTTFVYSVTTANRYRYFKLAFVADAVVQHSHVTDVQFKTWITGGELNTGAAVTDGVATLTSGSISGAVNAAFSGTMSIGGTTTAAAITASGLITANAGVTLGGGDHLTGSSTSNIVFNTDKFTVAGATGNTAVGGTLNVTGITTATGKVAANGGINLLTNSTVFWTKGGPALAVATGTDAACSNGDRYWSEIEIPYNTTITGLAYLVGSTGGTDSVVVQLVNNTGTQVATSRAVGGAAALVGSAGEFQSVAFTTPYAAVAGRYFVVVQFNGTTAKFRTYLIPGSKFIAGTASGTWGTAAGITPGTTFTAGKGPIIMTY